MNRDERSLPPLPSVADRLRRLQPSQELLEFYRQKIAEFDGEHGDMLVKLERYKATFEEMHKQEWGLAQREEEVAELQRALSDMQVYLFQEREHVLRLYAENDRLKIQELEDRKKIQTLLGLTQPVEHEATYFRKPEDGPIIQPKHAPSAQHSQQQQQQQQKKEKIPQQESLARKPAVKTAGKGNSAGESDASFKDQNEVLLLTVESLKAQLQDQARLAKEQQAAMMEDRRVREEETRIALEKMAEKNKQLLDRLHHTQDLLYDSTRDFLELKFDHRQREVKFSEEKEHLVERIEELKDDLDTVHAETAAAINARYVPEPEYDQESGKEYRDAGTNAYRPGGRFKDGSESDATSTATAASSAKTAITTQKDNMQETLAEMYREQCIKLEDELCRFKEEKASKRDQQSEKTEKQAKRIQMWERRYEALEQRRALEVEGYKTDIRMLRKRLKELEKQLYRLAMHIGESQSDVRMLEDVHKSARRSKTILGELQQLKAMIHSMENDVRHVHDV